MRPEYEPEDIIHSISSWEEACARSQQWALGARQAAVRRKRYMTAMSTVAVILMIAVIVILVLFLTRNLIKEN
jgi:heme/copper-type cytochrome/quinol oxidase subunit 2